MTYCFVCTRATDHFAEHDALVEAGLAAYDTESGSVYRTAAWDDRFAELVSEVDFQHYMRDGYDGVDLAAVVTEAKALLAAT